MKKIALITGATSGIGAACARKFAGAGYDLIITARTESALSVMAYELTQQFGVEVLPCCFDVRDREAVKRVVDSLPMAWRDIDVLINNAGLALGLEPEYAGDFTDWETMIDTNVKGLLYMTRLIVPGMVERQKGHVVNIGSVALSDGLRIDLVHTPVRVTNLKPGLVETNFSKVRFHGDTERAANVYKGITPLTGDDIADVALYAVQAPAHVQIAEVLILATHQASGSVICRS